MRTPRWLLLAAPFLFALAAGCSGETNPSDPTTPGPVAPPPPDTVVAPAPLGPEQQAQLDALLAEKEGSANMTSADFASKYAVSFAPGLSYDPTQADGLPLIQASAFALDAGDLQKLKEKGFVISNEKRFPSFVYGYDSIYAQDLPVYVSADSILHAVHSSYDAILKAVETASLVPELQKMLEEMRSKLAAGGAGSFGAHAHADADLFTAVALSLLTGKSVAPVAGADPAQIESFVAMANSHQGLAEVSLFGTDRQEDFSQFTPRGHYADSAELKAYFRSMMWLGRVDLRILETQYDGSQLFRRRQLEAAFLLRALAEGPTMARFERIDGAVRAFVGESDYMTLPELDDLLADLGAKDAADLEDIPDATIATVMMQKGYGVQQIASHVVVGGLEGATQPLNVSFALLGQRYVVDSHVFSNVVYDRVQKGGVKRMMPDPLDVGFAALGNNQAGQLLGPQLEAYAYAPDLHMMRVLVDAHGQSFWGKNLYNGWLSALRELSPSQALADTQGLPEVAKTEAWGRRLVNTQLASWAELRHDTLLYAKQSYTDEAGCQFPDAYVDPYPAFYQRLAEFAARGDAMAATLDLSQDPWLASALPQYFARLKDIAQMLGGMAENERAGLPLTSEQLAFINKAVKIKGECVPEDAEGWYAQLFFDVSQSLEFDPTIADVHAQPTDESGAVVGRVLHVGTGMPRLMVATVDTCGTPRAFVGLASAYHEKVTKNFERLTDAGWEDSYYQQTPADVPWMSDLISY